MATNLAAQQALLRWRDNPVSFVEEALKATPEDWQREALEALATDDRVAIRSGHGVGKSAFLSWLILWWLSTRTPAKVGCTAPSSHQLEDVLWSEVRLWLRRLPEALSAQFEITTSRIELKDAPGVNFAVARTAREEKPEALQGLHSENMLFLVDEASGVPSKIFEVGQGSLSTPGAKLVLAGNPTRTDGYFFNAFHRWRDAWWTRRVSCEESNLVGSKYGAEVASQYGIDSNVYRVRVLGDFPTSEDDVVIPIDLCEAAIERDVASTRYATVWGLDVARFGDDRSALAKRKGNRLVAPVEYWRGQDTMQTAGRVFEQYRECLSSDRPSEILVDVIGIGAGVHDRLRELGLPSRGINVGESASFSDKYVRRRDELWFNAREWFEKRDCSIFDDEALIAELTSVHYSITSAGKILVESKDQMKKRGLPSPDLADAFILTMAGGTIFRLLLEASSFLTRRRRRTP